MNILFDVNHPAHVHLFRNAIQILRRQGHQVFLTARDKDVTLSLLDKYHLEYICLSRARKGMLQLAWELLCRQIKLFPFLLKHRIQIVVSVTGACNVHVARLLGIPTLIFYDTEHATLQNSLALPFVTRFITPQAFELDFGKKQMRYPGTHDLAYLHPKYFTPERRILDELKLKDNEPFVLLRLVSWQAAHDWKHKGMSLELKRKIIDLCQRHARVFISSESELPEEFEKFRFVVSPEKMHDTLSFATLYIGDGGSMATEAAVLGTPAIFISPLSAGVFKDFEKNYDLMYSFKPFQEEAILERIEELLSTAGLKDLWEKKRRRFLAEKIDVTQFMVDTILTFGKAQKA